MTDPQRPFLASLPAALGVFLLAMFLTVAVTLFAVQSTREQERAAFEALTGRVQTAIVQRMQTYTNLMYAGRAYLLGSGEVSRSDWQDFVTALDIESRFPGIQGLGFAIRIPPGELAEKVAQVRRSDLPSFHVWPGGDRPELTAILYLEPMDARNQAAIGYDMYSEPVRREAMARARDTGQPALSGKVSLVQEITEVKQAGFLIYLPVYRDGQKLDTVSGRRAGLLGYVYAPFRADDLFTGLFGSQRHPNIDFEIYDGPPKPETLLYDHNPDVYGQTASTTGFQRSVSSKVAGHTWTVVYTGTPEFTKEGDRGLVLAVFVSGTLVSLLLGGITWSLASSRSRALAMATEMTAELRKADQAKDEFLSVISHELRTPLNFIMGFGSILQDEIPGALNPKQQEYLGKMLNGVDRMLILVNDLLDFAKIQAGKLDLLPTRTDFVPLAEEVHATMKPLADQKNLTLALDLPEHLILVADGPRLVQVLTNLIGNAIKFTPAGGRIVLRSRFDGPDLLTEVSDTGIGISPEDLPKLFTRFKQLDMSSTRRVGGTGLGLSISKAIVEGHGGSIGVQSETDKGSKFWFRVPVDGPQA